MTLRLGVVLPTYNERGNLRTMVERLDAALVGLVLSVGPLVAALIFLVDFITSALGAKHFGASRRATWCRVKTTTRHWSQRDTSL